MKDNKCKRDDELSSIERRKMLKKTAKAAYSAPLLVMLSTSLDALEPPPPPEKSDTLNINLNRSTF